MMLRWIATETVGLWLLEMNRVAAHCHERAIVKVVESHIANLFLMTDSNPATVSASNQRVRSTLMNGTAYHGCTCLPSSLTQVAY